MSLAAMAGLVVFAQAGLVDHTFVFVAPEPVRSVNLAGSFNNWDKMGEPLVLQPDGRTWKRTRKLSPGKHYYKFVLDGENWIVDPKAWKNEGDGNGNTNSVLLLQPKDYARSASATDGVIAQSALWHEQQAPYLNYDRGRLHLRFRVRPGDVKSIRAYVGGGKYLPMTREGGDEFFATYGVQVPWDRKRDISYAFFLDDGGKTFFYGRDGYRDNAKGGGRPFELGAKAFKPFETPQWVEGAVFYQIFPDRFENGDKGNDPKDVSAWSAKPEWFNRFGGDIAGVRKRLGHLTNLGVNAVYFNPVFKSPSNHRYDATDFKAIDPQFGTNDQFVQLTREMDAKGIRTVMDFVFNHTAVDFEPFMDLREKGEASRYKAWYFPKSFPIEVKENPNYVAWFNFPSMPKLNVLNPETKNYLLGLMDYWRSRVPLAGIRLDVANEVDTRFWQSLRQKVKREDQDFWIVGEVWGDGSPWLKGDQWDSVMNYQFRDACLKFFADGSTTPSQFTGQLMRVHNSYAPQVSRNMMNLLSSHDTPRFLTLCKGDRDLMKLAAVVQFTWIGAPSVYYGEELGMEGGADPDNRRGMRWDLATSNNGMLAHYRKLIGLRKSSRALQSGDPKILVSDNSAETVAFGRELGNEKVVVAINRSRSPRTVSVPLSQFSTGKLQGLLGAKPTSQDKAKVIIHLPPRGYAVLQSAGSGTRSNRASKGAVSSRKSSSKGSRRNP